MLNRLSIKNVALIDSADIEFDCGLNVLSGETGSGKSVILDSINFVLGSKADKTMIRFGENETTVKAEFSVGDKSEVVQILNNYDIDCDGNVIISRKFNQQGKGSIKINGESVTLSMLKTISQHLVDVHGQSEHFYLLNTSNQLKVLDSLSGDKLSEDKAMLSQYISKKRSIKEQLSQFGSTDFERTQRIDLLTYQINEIKSVDLRIGEFDELKQKQNVILNAEKILTALNSIKQYFDEDNGCKDLIYQASRQANSITSVNVSYERLSERLMNFQAEAEDITDCVSSLCDDISFDDAEAAYVDERLTIIKSLMRKYGANEEDILSFLENAENELDSLVNSTEIIESLNDEIAKLNEKIFNVCTSITKIRKCIAQSFSKNVENELASLNIPNAKFEISFNDYDISNANLDSMNGSDVIEFQFSANKGEPLKPLSSVISGGEMSRFMLAIKTQLKDVNNISTYVFDEIDSGISGFTATTVADKFLNISKTTQIIAVSHLPQVCAVSDSQFLIYKIEQDDKTYSKIKKLSNDEKIEEIIRLTGGVASDVARKHAEELIKNKNK